MGVGVMSMNHVPMLTYFYTSPLTKKRVDDEANRLNAVCLSKVTAGMVTNEEYRVWRENMESWRNSWISRIAGGKES